MRTLLLAVLSSVAAYATNIDLSRSEYSFWGDDNGRRALMVGATSAVTVWPNGERTEATAEPISGSTWAALADPSATSLEFIGMVSNGGGWIEIDGYLIAGCSGRFCNIGGPVPIANPTQFLIAWGAYGGGVTMLGDEDRPVMSGGSIDARIYGVTNAPEPGTYAVVGVVLLLIVSTRHWIGSRMKTCASPARHGV